MRHEHLHVHSIVDSAHASLHGEMSGRIRALDIGGFAKDVGGVLKGAGEQLVETVGGVVEAVTHPADTAKGVVSLVADPTESWPALWHGIADPITEDWKNGNPGEAIGRGLFGILEAVVGTKGVTKVGKVIRKMPDAPKSGPDLDAPKPKPDADAPVTPTPITPSTRVLERTFGPLDPDDAAFAHRVNVRHVFEGDEFGGRHVAPGSGSFNGVDISELKHASGRTWQADVTFRDAQGELVTKTTTMFPSEWSPTEVLQSIRRAEGNAVETGKTRQIKGRTIDILEGEDRGLKIVIHRDHATNEVLSAMPKHVNKPFEAVGS